MFACIYIPNASAETDKMLMACANTFSPRVESTAPGTVVFDVEGLERLFGSYSQIAEQIATRLEMGPLPCQGEKMLLFLSPWQGGRPAGAGRGSIALAANSDAAICAARGFEG